MVDKNFTWIAFLLFQVSSVSSFSSFLESATSANLTEQRHFRPRRQIDCNNLNQQNTPGEIINAKCTTLKAPGILYEFNIATVQDNWYNIGTQLEHIEGIHLVFNGLSAGSINLHKLKKVERSKLTITLNPKLNVINVRVTDHLNASIVISDNPRLRSVILAAGPEGLAGHEVWIDRNPQLRTINMDNLEKIEVEKPFIIDANIMLMEIKLGSLKQVKSESFEVRRNKILRKLELPKLVDFQTKILVIDKHNDLATINFNPQNIKKMTADNFVIRQNKKLTKIEISKEKVATRNLIVAGNPILPTEALNFMHQVHVSNKKIIQVFGECLFDELITDFTELDNCTMINSPVNFTSSTTGAITSNKLVRINGDVYLAGLRPEQVNFLSQITITGKIRSDICEFKLHNHVVESPKCPTTTTTTTAATTTAATKTVATTTMTTTTMTSTTMMASTTMPTTTATPEENTTTVMPTIEPIITENTTTLTQTPSTEQNTTTFVPPSLPIATTATPTSTTSKSTTSRRGTTSKSPPYSATTILDPAKPPVGTPSGSRNSTAKPLTSGKSTAKRSGSKIGMIVGVIAGIVLLIVIIIVVCLCVSVPAGGGKKGKVKLYKRVFPCFNKTTNETSIVVSNGIEKSKGPAHGQRREASNGKKLPRVTSRQSKPSPEPKATPQSNAQTTKPASTTPSLASVSGRPPTERSAERMKTPKVKSKMEQPKPSATTAPAAQAVKTPRLSYQHDLLQRMEEFLEDTGNYEDLIKEVSSKKNPT